MSSENGIISFSYFRLLKSGLDKRSGTKGYELPVVEAPCLTKESTAIPESVL